MGLEESIIETASVRDPQQTEQQAYHLNIQDIAQSIVFPKSIEHLSSQNIKFINDILTKVHLFAELPDKQKQRLINKFMICYGGSDEWVLKEGTQANYFFIIAEGHVDVVKNGFIIRSLGVGDYFGEVALLYGVNRSSSIRVPKQYRNKNKYYVLLRKYFIESLQSVNPTKYNQFLKLIQNNSFFHYLTVSNKIQLAKYSNKISFKKNERILSKYDQPYALFLIVEGSVQLTFPNKRQVQISRGSIFGYIGQSVISCSASSLTEIVIYAIGKDTVNKILKSNIKYLYLWNKIKFILINSTYTLNLSLKRIDELTNLFNYRYVKQNEIICINNTKIKYIYIPISCHKKQNNNEIVGFKQKLEGKKKYMFDFVAQKSGYYAEINADVFVEIIKNEDIKFERDNQLTFDITKSEILTVFRKECNKPQRMLCRQNKYNLYYILDVANCEVEGEVNYLKHQSQILQKLNCKFIKGHYFFIKRGREYLLGQQFIRGTKIKSIIMKIGMIPLSIFRFYISCVVVALEYLHQNGVLCTGLKVDSLKIDAQGYLWLSEFQGVIMNDHMQQTDHQTTFGMKKGINNFCDLAEIAYQLLIGKEINFRELIGKTIQQLKQQEIFQNCFITKQEKQLLISLLGVNKISNNEWKRIKELNFFSGIDWYLLQNKEMEAPVVPGFMFFDNNKI